MEHLLYEKVRPRQIIERDTVDEDGFPAFASIDTIEEGQVIKIMPGEVTVEFEHGTYRLKYHEIERASVPNDESRYKNLLI